MKKRQTRGADGLTPNQSKVYRAILKLTGTNKAVNTKNVCKLSKVPRASMFSSTRALEKLGFISITKVGTEDGKRGFRIYEATSMKTAGEEMKKQVEESTPPSGIPAGLTYSDLGRIVSTAIIGMTDKVHILTTLNQSLKSQCDNNQRILEEADKAIKENIALRARVDNLTQMFVELQRTANIPDDQLPIAVRQAIETAGKTSPFKKA
jgi:predicted transcriptional regulator